MAKTINEETDLRLLGLLAYLSLNKDKNGFFCLGYRELSRRTGMSEKWIRTAVKKLEDYKVLKAQSPALLSAVSSALLSAPKKSCNMLIHILFASTKEDSESALLSAHSSAPKEDENKLTFEKLWKRYRRDGSKGNKTSAYKNYLKLSKKDKEDMASFIGYFMAFTLPKYRPMMPKFIKDKTWQYPREFNGKEIPMTNYKIADIEAFKSWFNRKVEGTDIPKVVEVTPERHVNLNICYTLYPGLMTKAMKIVKENEFYIKGAKDGWLTFDYIFNPVNLIKICEQGGKE